LETYQKGLTIKKQHVAIVISKSFRTDQYNRGGPNNNQTPTTSKVILAQQTQKTTC
jgi:hypothetical protein